MDRISVILPSRGRWDSLKEAIQSLTAGNDPELEIIVGLDDDVVYPVEELNEFSGVKVSVNPRPKNPGALFNLLYTKATGDWFIPFPDDYVMVDVDWCDRLRNAVERLPLKLGVAYLNDSLYPGFSTFPVLHRETIEMNGFFMPEFFPFLFGDTWWNEVGNLSGVKQPINASVLIKPEHGNTHKQRDMLVWATLFEKTRPLRTETSIKIIKKIYETYEYESDWLVSTIPSRIEMCEERQKYMFTPEFLGRWDNTDPNPPSEAYLKLKSSAEIINSQF